MTLQLHKVIMVSISPYARFQLRVHVITTEARMNNMLLDHVFVNECVNVILKLHL
jgi:hypothetical protein